SAPGCCSPGSSPEPRRSRRRGSSRRWRRVRARRTSLRANRKGSPRMRLDFLERYSMDDAPLQRLGARLKLVATIAYVVVVVATPIGWWGALAVEGLVLSFLVGLSGVPPRALAARWLGFLVLFGFFTVMVAPARPERAEFGLAVVALTILVKDSLAFLATLLLVQVTPFRTL